MLDFSNLPQARIAFKQLLAQVEAIIKWDFKGARLRNIGKGIDAGDAVNVSQLSDELDKVRSEIPKDGDASNSLDVDTLRVKDLVVSSSITAATDNAVDIGTTGSRFKKLWLYSIELTSSLLPRTNNAADLGSSGLRLRKLWLYTIDIVTSMLPSVDNAADLGSSSFSWRAIYCKSFYALNGTASLPAKLDASKVLTSGAINLASSTEVTGTLPVDKGGTGAATLGAYGVVVGNGTGAVHVTGTGSANQVLTSNGASANPTFQAAPAPSASSINTGILGQGYGGTGFSSLSTSDLRNNLNVPERITVTAHTITLAKITGGGTDGSITWNADGLITAYVDPT